MAGFLLRLRIEGNMYLYRSTEWFLIEYQYIVVFSFSASVLLPVSIAFYASVLTAYSPVLCALTTRPSPSQLYYQTRVSIYLLPSYSLCLLCVVYCLRPLHRPHFPCSLPIHPPTLTVFYKLNISTKSKLIKVRVILSTLIPCVPVPRLHSTPLTRTR